MEKDPRVRAIGCTTAKLLRRETGSRVQPSSQPHLPRGARRGCVSTLEAGSPGAAWLGRRPEASGQQREPGPWPGRLPAREARGARSGSAPPGPARGPRRRRPASQLRPLPQPAAAPGVQLPPSRGRPASCPRLQSLLTRLLCPCPTRPTERTAPFTSHCSVLLFSRVFVFSSRPVAKSENLRWSPRAGRAKPGRRGRGAGAVGVTPGVGVSPAAKDPTQPCTI